MQARELVFVSSLLIAASGATAQTAAVREAATPATQLLLIGRDGERTTSTKTLPLELKTQVLKQGAAVDQVLHDNGLADDARTRAMLKRLNPDSDFTNGQIPAGTKLHVYGPKLESEADRQRVDGRLVSFNAGVVGRWAVKDQAAFVADLQSSSRRLNVAAFADRDSLVRHQKAITDIAQASKVLQDHADNLSAEDFAVARYQIDYASRLASRLNQTVLASGKADAASVQEVQVAADGTQPIEMRMMSGQAPLPRLRVKVNVIDATTAAPVKGLQVYAVPSGVMDHPDLFSDAEVLTYLTTFSFVDETSPASQDVPLFDARLWVGPKLKFNEMTALIKARRISLFQPLGNTGSNPVPEMIFRSPTDLVQP